jgi:citrate lyase beta subunit
MQGMAQAGGPAAQLTEEDMLADVWGREAEVRASTREWLYSYFALAYQPLEDRELQDYTAFWESDAGQKANAAVFAAFDQVFTDISRELGRAAAVQMQGDDI